MLFSLHAPSRCSTFIHAGICILQHLFFCNASASHRGTSTGKFGLKGPHSPCQNMTVKVCRACCSQWQSAPVGKVCATYQDQLDSHIAGNMCMQQCRQWSCMAICIAHTRIFVLTCCLAQMYRTYCNAYETAVCCREADGRHDCDDLVLPKELHLYTVSSLARGYGSHGKLRA